MFILSLPLGLPTVLVVGDHVDERVLESRFSDVNRGDGDGVPLGEPIDFRDHGLGSGGRHAICTGPGVLHQTTHICRRAQCGSERLELPWRSLNSTARALPNRRLRFSGVSICTIRPWLITAIRSQRYSASSRMCVVKKIVKPLWTRSFRYSGRAGRPVGGEPTVG